MQIKKTPEDVWREYGKGKSYKDSLELYDIVKRNNDFYMDKQWKDVKAPDWDKPVLNILKPTVNYYVAMLISDDIAVNVELMGSVEGGVQMRKKVVVDPQAPLDAMAVMDRRYVAPVGTQRSGSNGERTSKGAGGAFAQGAETERSGLWEDVVQGAGYALEPDTMPFGLDEIIPKVLAAEVEDVLERTNARHKNREALHNSAVDGDACFYLWFDPDVETGYGYKGAIRIDVVDNTDVYFGDPTNPEVQEQPYLIIAFRKLTEEVKDEAEANGLNPDEITPDGDADRYNSDKQNDNDYTTVLLKLWRENKEIRFLKCTQNAMVKKETETGYRLYPLDWTSWESVKNSYHGSSPLTGKINNQIFINKAYAMMMRFVLLNAFPKIIYDEGKIPEGWNNNIGEAIKTSGDPRDAIFTGFSPPPMSGDVLNLAQNTMQQTKELMGASDPALGQFDPSKASGAAIVAVQNATGAPLDIQRKNFHDFVEAYVRIIIEMMATNYGTRFITLTDNEGNKLTGEFDFSVLKNHVYSLKVDIGPGTYWSEILNQQTVDGLMTNGILGDDPALYLELIPDKNLPQKNTVLEKVKQKEEQRRMMEEQQMAMQAARQQPQGPPPDMLPMEAPQEEAMEPPVDMPLEPEYAEMAPEEQDPYGGLTPEQFEAALQTLLELPPERIEAAIEQMNVPDEAKALLLEAVTRALEESNG